jgi:hypothetical protein
VAISIPLLMYDIFTTRDSDPIGRITNYRIENWPHSKSRTVYILAPDVRQGELVVLEIGKHIKVITFALLFGLFNDLLIVALATD